MSAELIAGTMALNIATAGVIYYKLGSIEARLNSLEKTVNGHRP